MLSCYCYGEEYTLRRNVSMDKKMEQKRQLDGKFVKKWVKNRDFVTRCKQLCE